MSLERDIQFAEIDKEHALAGPADALCVAEFERPLKWGARNRTFAASATGELVGFANSRLIPTVRYATVGSIAVAPAWRGRGVVGSVLLQGIEAVAIDEGYDMLWASPLNPSSERLNFKNGYVWHPNSDTAMMIKELKSTQE